MSNQVFPENETKAKKKSKISTCYLEDPLLRVVWLIDARRLIGSRFHKRERVKMKKVAILLGGFALVAVLSGLSLAEITEYGTVVRNDAKEAIQGAISTDVELKRLTVILQKVDTKAANQKRIVAKAQVALEDAQMQLARSKAKCEQIKTQMVSARNKPTTYVTTCGAKLSTGSSKQLAILLSSYKTHVKTLEARDKAVVAHRDAVLKLTARFNGWMQQRELLHQQLESLQARHAANQIAKVNADVISSDELSRAVELRKEIETRIRVEEHIDSDATVSTFDWSSEIPIGSESVESQVDEILSVSSSRIADAS